VLVGMPEHESGHHSREAYSTWTRPQSEAIKQHARFLIAMHKQASITVSATIGRSG
jgi:hypothetical protein